MPGKGGASPSIDAKGSKGSKGMKGKGSKGMKGHKGMTKGKGKGIGLNAPHQAPSGGKSPPVKGLKGGGSPTGFSSSPEGMTTKGGRGGAHKGGKGGPPSTPPLSLSEIRQKHVSEGLLLSEVPSYGSYTDLIRTVTELTPSSESPRVSLKKLRLSSSSTGLQGVSSLYVPYITLRF